MKNQAISYFFTHALSVTQNMYISRRKMSFDA